MLVPGLWDACACESLVECSCLAGGMPVFCEGLVWNARAWDVECLRLQWFGVERSCAWAVECLRLRKCGSCLGCGNACALRKFGVECSCLACGMFAFAMVWCGMLVPDLWNARVLRGFGVECSRLGCGMLVLGERLVWNARAGL